VSLVQKVFPGSTVDTEAGHHSKVKIESIKPLKTMVAECSQRDLYRKYRWPAGPGMEAKLKMLREVADEL